MKVVLTVSKTFFPKHPKAGQETHFADKIKYAVWMENQAEICKEKGYDFDCRTCTDACRDLDLTPKIHTCRANYGYWEKKIARLKEAGGVLSVRQWSDKPYRSPQETIIDIPAEIVGVQKLRLVLCNDKSLLTSVDGKSLLTSIVAKNDGLWAQDYIDWFAPVFRKEQKEVLDFAIIHFTKFRY
jgi:hypothetical protein